MTPFDNIVSGEIAAGANLFGRVLVLDFVPDNVREVAMKTGATLFLLTDEPSHYHDYIWPDNVWLGVRACTKDKVDLLVARVTSLTSNVWLSCTPRDPIIVPDAVKWLFCNLDETGPMYPDMVRQLRDSAAAKSIPFWFHGWGGWVETSRTKEPIVQVGDAVVRRDGIIVGTVDHIDYRDNGTIREMSAKRIPDPSGKRLRPPPGAHIGPPRPKYKLNRSLGPEIFMRRIQDNPNDHTIDGKMWRALP